MSEPASNPFQHTQEWFLARRGHITSSRMKTIVHGGPRAWTTLINLLQREMTSDAPIEPDLDHVPAIAHGRQYEPIARVNAELMLDEEIELVGFVEHPQLEWLGCSSDGLLLKRTVNAEIKCPKNLEKHIQVYQTRQMPDEHRPQVECQMCVHDVDETLFISYHPNAAHWKLRTVIVEVRSDRAYREMMLEKCEQFLKAFRGETPVQPRSITIPKYF